MPIVDLDGGVSYHLLAFDSDGAERTDDPDGLMSDRAVAELAGGDITDVFLASHGWRGDVPAALQQYERWIGAMADVQADRDRIRVERPGFASLVVGIHWPSEPFGDEDLGGAVDFAADHSLEDDVEKWAGRTVDTPETRAALRVLLSAVEENPTPMALPPEVVAAYDTLSEAMGTEASGPGGPPGEDWDGFDAQHLYQSAESEVDFAGGFGWGDLLTPLRQLSFWKMKARARRIGEGGAAAFLHRMQTAPGSAGTRFHLMGHSFGCIVVTSMIAGQQAARGPARNISSLVLVQGALSTFAYSSRVPETQGPGYFRPLVDRADVAGPIVVTRTRHDKATGTWYPKAAGLAGHEDFAPEDEPPTYGALGTFGMRGEGLAAVELGMVGPDADYGFEAGRTYNLIGDDVMDAGGFFSFSGAHSDIAHPEVAHAVWEAARISPLR